MGKVPPPAPCKIESIQQGKGVYQLVEARNSPRFGPDDAKTGAVFDFVASERRPERQKLQNTLDFAHRDRGDPCFRRFTCPARGLAGAVSLMGWHLFVADVSGWATTAGPRSRSHGNSLLRGMLRNKFGCLGPSLSVWKENERKGTPCSVPNAVLGMSMRPDSVWLAAIRSPR